MITQPTDIQPFANNAEPAITEGTRPKAAKQSIMLEVVRGRLSYDAAAAQLEVAPNQIIAWETAFLNGGAQALSILDSSGQDPENNHELLALSAVNQLLGGILNVTELLNETVTTLNLLFGYLPCVALIREMDITVSVGFLPNGQQLTAPLHFSINSETIIAISARNGQLVNIADLGSDNNFGDAHLSGARSVLALPIIFKGSVLGVLAVHSPQPKAFTVRDINVLETIALQLAVAIENATLFDQIERRIRQLELFRSIAAQAIEELDVQAIITYTVRITRDLMEYPAVAVLMFQDDTATPQMSITSIWPNAGGGENFVEMVQAVPAGSVVEALLQYGQTQHIRQVVAGKTALPLQPSSQSVLSVPILSGWQLIGALHVESEKARAFDSSDMATLKILADQLSVAVRGAGLYEKTHAQITQISLFRRLADEAIVGIITRDQAGLIDYANGAAAAMFGYASPELIIGQKITDFYADPAVLAYDNTIYAEAIAGGGWLGEVRQRRLDGEAITVEMSLFPIYSPAGPLLTCGVTLLDITERRTLMDIVQSSNERFEAIFDATEDGFMVWDTNWQLLMVNQQTEKLLNMPANTLIGLKRHSALERPALKAILEAPENERIQLQGVRQYVKVRHIPWVSVGVNAGQLTVIYDETNNVALEEARNDMISMLVHDLRGPITGILGGVELAQSVLTEDVDPERARHFLRMAHRSTSKVLSLANSLLDISKLEAGQMQLECEAIQPRALCDDVIAALETAAASANLDVQIHIDADLPTIAGDVGLIRRALINLYDNAIKYSPNKSNIRLSAHREDDDRLCFMVADSGPGVPEAYQRAIFEKYRQVPGQKSRRKGTGLGLAFCRLVAEAHHGRIWVEQRPGGGSIFALVVADCSVAVESADRP
jgi:PAS domain S-box-containing protein